jgi:hypothetical protein
MSLFSNIFGAPAPAPVATPAPTPAPVAAPVADVSPLDQFNTLWEPSASTGADNTLPANMFAGADPAKMLDAARKVDFAKSIPQDVIAKITAGGPEAAAAFASAINDVSQQSYAKSSFAATKIVEAALAKFQEGLDTRLPSQIKKHQVSDSIRQTNPALTHPAAAPILEALQSQFTVKYPNATVSEINDMATQYLNKFSEASQPKKVDKTPESENWGAFFES